MMLRRLLRLIALAGVAAIAACTTTTTTGPSGKPIAETPETADPARAARDRLELAGLYLARGQTTVALESVDRALAARPDLPEAYNLRGLIYGAMGDAPRAEESFRRALQMAPGSGDTLHNYGWFLCQQRRYDDADVQFRNAVAQPQYREVVRTLLAQGVCQARAGRWLDAEKSLARSYELDPTNPVTAYNLSDVLLHRGELERARFYINRINSVPELTTSQSLWLAARIERRLGNVRGVQDFGRRLQARFPDSGEALQFEQGRFDD
jgi:type IV pilus assembly protein PilF